MTVTIDLAPELQNWIADKVKRGAASSPEQFAEQLMVREFLEEQIGEAIAEPSTPLTKDDWDLVRENLEKQIAARHAGGKEKTLPR